MLSQTQKTNYIAFAGVVVVLLGKLGVETDTETIITIIGAGISLWGIISNFIHRYKKGDVTALGGYRQ